jgi:tetratricopeptide (TPR) repeat protein
LDTLLGALAGRHVALSPAGVLGIERRLFGLRPSPQMIQRCLLELGTREDHVREVREQLARVRQAPPLAPPVLGLPSSQGEAALLLGVWGVEEAVPRLWERALFDDMAATALARTGPIAAAHLRGVLAEAQPDWQRILQAAEELDLHTGAVLWREHLPELLIASCGDPRPLVRYGDEALLPRLWEEVQPGEGELAEAYLWLCHLHGVAAQPLPAADPEWAALYTGRPAPPGQPRVRVRLQCTVPACRRTYGYYVRLIWVDPAPVLAGAAAQPVVCDRIRCKRCGAIDQYTLTPEAFGEVAVLLANPAVQEELAMGRRVMYGPLRLGSVRLPDGRPGGIREAHEQHRAAARARPDLAAARVGYGSVLLEMGRCEEAEIELRAALLLQPGAAEALFGLATIALLRQDREQAMRHLLSLLRLERPFMFYLGAESWPRLRADAELKVRELRQSGVLRGGLRAAPRDLCPCGSGRRYKSCCLASDRASYEEQI